MGLPLKGLREKVLHFLGKDTNSKTKNITPFKKEKLTRSKTLHNAENTKCTHPRS